MIFVRELLGGKSSHMHRVVKLVDFRLEREKKLAEIMIVKIVT